MKWLNRHKRFFALTGDSTQTVLAEVQKTATALPALRVLATAEGSVLEEVTVRRLLSAATESLRGSLSIALPLHFFEVVTVSLPVMPEIAVGKALPYHLAKTVNRPLSELIYDWQVTKVLKDKIQVTVYLFPAQTFQFLRREMARRQLETTWLEADVFAAFAYLGREGRLKPAETTLCALLWPGHVSLAVYEQDNLLLVRTVAADQPSSADDRAPADQKQGMAVTPQQSAGELDLDLGDKDPVLEEAGRSQPEGAESILAGFNILAEEELEMTSPPSREYEPAPAAPQEEGGWSRYVKSINLEMIRTRDYYGSVIKGNPIRRVVLAGADSCWDAIEGLAASSLGVPVQPLIRTPMTPNCPSILAAIAAGTGARW